MVFERQHTQIASVEAIHNKKMKVVWPEGRELFDFTFKLKDAFGVVKEIVERHKYDDNFPDLVGVNTVFLSEKEQIEIIEKRTKNAESNMDIYKKLLDEANLELNMIASDDPDKTKKILEASGKSKQLHDVLEMWTKYKTDIPNVIMNRSKKIPKDVPNSRCWNDCWFDIESDCFITFNELWNVDWLKKYLKEYNVVKKFHEKNTIPNVCAIPFDFIKYENGYPVYHITYSESDVKIGIMPTMTDEMLNDEMISKKTGVDIQTVGDSYPVEIKKSVVYNVSSGSKLILKNGDRYFLTRKETIFLLNRKMISKKDIPLLP